MKWLVIGLGLLVVAGLTRHRVKMARLEHWVNTDA
jgi:hypothetical protein